MSESAERRASLNGWSRQRSHEPAVHHERWARVVPEGGPVLVLRETVESVRSAGREAVERAPLVGLDLRLGQGSGVMQAVPLVRTAARVLNKVSAVDAVIDEEGAS